MVFVHKPHAAFTSPDATSAHATTASSPVMPILAVLILAFVLLGGKKREPPKPPGTTGDSDASDAPPQTQPPGYGKSTASSSSRDVDYTNALAPIMAVGGLVLAARTGKLPEGATRAIERMFSSDLVALFATVAYAHYLFNYEDSHLDADERFYDAIFRVGAFVASIWCARKLLSPSQTTFGG